LVDQARREPKGPCPSARTLVLALCQVNTTGAGVISLDLFRILLVWRACDKTGGRARAGPSGSARRAAGIMKTRGSGAPGSRTRLSFKAWRKTVRSRRSAQGFPDPLPDTIQIRPGLPRVVLCPLP